MKRCGARRGKWFSIGSKADWTYLLPKALGRGRYVLDLKTIDGAGNADSKLARTRNRVVFFVALGGSRIAGRRSPPRWRAAAWARAARPRASR